MNIWAMTVQNEPLNNASWEACFLVTSVTWVSAEGFGSFDLGSFCHLIYAFLACRDCTHPKCSKGCFSDMLDFHLEG